MSSFRDFPSLAVTVNFDGGSLQSIAGKIGCFLLDYTVVAQPGIRGCHAHWRRPGRHATAPATTSATRSTLSRSSTTGVALSRRRNSILRTSSSLMLTSLDAPPLASLASSADFFAQTNTRPRRARQEQRWLPAVREPTSPVTSASTKDSQPAAITARGSRMTLV